MLVLTCEHASNRVPPSVDLGVPAEVLESHVAWDHGAVMILAGVASATGAPAFRGLWTRIYVDLNRSPHNPQVIPEIAFGTPIPGNIGLTAEQRAERLRTAHAPYRAEVSEAVADSIRDFGECVHLSMHSFTPEPLGGVPRDFDIGILFDPDRARDVRVAEILLSAFNSAGFSALANRPYGGTGDGFTTTLRERHEHYAGIEVETSHRVTNSAGGIQMVVNTLVQAVPRLIQMQEG